MDAVTASSTSDDVHPKRLARPDAFSFVTSKNKVPADWMGAA
jgi:hypothetical protein